MMSSEESTPGGERVSRFREHTNTNSTIRAPPEEMWKDFGTELLLDKFTAEQATTPAASRKRHPRHIMDKPSPVEPPTPEQRLAIAQRPIATPRTRKQSDGAATVATAEGTFGRFSRLFTGIFTGVLGKRKSDADEPFGSPLRSNSLAPDQATLDHRKQAAEEAYHLAKAQGLLPAPKVFVRPGMPQRAWTSGDNAAENPSTTPSASRPTAPDTDTHMQTRTPLRPLPSMHTPLTGTRPRPPLTPRTPGSVARSPSKRDLKAQKKLSRRVSSLEVKLASAKKELASVLGGDVCFPAVPPLPPPSAACGDDEETVGLRGGEADAGTRDGERSSSPPQANTLMSDDALPLSPSRGEPQSAALPREIAKRRRTARKRADDDAEAAFLSHPAFSDVDMSEYEPEREGKGNVDQNAEQNEKPPKKAKKVRKSKSRNRLVRKSSRSSVLDAEEKEERVVVVRPGGAVPPVPVVPDGIKGKKVVVVAGEGEGDDGYGGLGHEIF